MSRASFTLVRRVMFLSFLAVLVCAAPGRTDMDMTRDIEGLNLTGGGTVTGNFTIDRSDLHPSSAWDAPRVSPGVSNWAITVRGTAVTNAGVSSLFDPAPAEPQPPSAALAYPNSDDSAQSVDGSELQYLGIVFDPAPAVPQPPPRH